VGYRTSAGRPRDDTVKQMCVGFDATHSAANALHWAGRVARVEAEQPRADSRDGAALREERR